MLRVEATTGARWILGSTGGLDVRGSLGLSVWPRAWGGTLGIAVEVESGPGVSIDAPVFLGAFHETALRVPIRACIPVGTWLEIQPMIGGAVHAASMGGTVLSTGAHVSALRMNPAVAAGLFMDFVVAPRVRVGTGAEATYLVRTQRYFAGGWAFFDPSPLELGARLRLSVAFN
jgi:hypothetical protein